MKTTILNNSSSPLLGGITNYIDKVKKEQVKKLIKKTYSPKNTYALLDFLIHATAAKDNLHQLLHYKINNEQIEIELRKFDSLFAPLDKDFEIMQNQDDDELANIMDSTDELATNLAFFNVVNNTEFHKVVDDYRVDRVSIGKVVDEINNDKEYKYFQFALSKEHIVVKNTCELIINLIFVSHWSDKFVNVSGYNPVKIKAYIKNLLNLLEPIAKTGLKEVFNIETENSIVENYQATSKAFFSINTSAKVEFMRLFKAYNSDSKKLIQAISNIKLNKQMEKINQLTQLTAQAQTEAEAFYNKGNKAAGTRLRKVMMEIKNLTADVRKDVIEVRNA